MSVYKEGWAAIDWIRNHSRRIYPDAADYGALTKKGDSTWNWAKQLVDWYKVEGTRTEENYETGRSVTSIVSIIDEHGTGKELRFYIEYVTVSDVKGYDGFISVTPIPLNYEH